MQRRQFLSAAAAIWALSNGTLPGNGENATDEFPFPVPDNCPFCGELLQDAGDDGLYCPGCDSTMPAGFYSTVAYRDEFDMRIEVPVGVPEQTLAVARDRLGENPDPGRFYDHLLDFADLKFYWYGPQGECLPEFEEYYDDGDY